MSLQVEKVSKVVGWWTVIGGAGVALFIAVNSYFATRLMMEEKDLRRINEDITHNEVVRDHYQTIKDRHDIDGERNLTVEELRRYTIAKSTLDRLYDEKGITEDTLRELKE